jgi:hypothetical protein
MAEPSTRAKWRALRSARSSTLKKCLTGIHIVRDACLQQLTLAMWAFIFILVDWSKGLFSAGIDQTTGTDRWFCRHPLRDGYTQRATLGSQKGRS